jgi:hypothetical protein
MKMHKYEVWATGGQGGFKVKNFKTLEIALAFVEKNKGSASLAIKYPDGSWHKWN